ncbi:hypothetical protein LJ739_15210 [Aestuariibacter halophilus]|uniref:YtxH domain-containing protein n=1 Tax=Fluctibacter halophilus TaxID=226011 RepID=A0ABS8GBY2_9ALTE|nr:hypothetical protein [Aestuariibacter halophilus]MCC2617601.1 hypothetical protein [Aestuariibacter halophilus]
MKTVVKLVPFSVLMVALLALGGCGEDDTAEDTGKKVDEWVAESKDALEDAGDDVKDLAEDARDDLDDKATDVGNAIEDACENAKEQLDTEDKDC